MLFPAQNPRLKQFRLRNFIVLVPHSPPCTWQCLMGRKKKHIIFRWNARTRDLVTKAKYFAVAIVVHGRGGGKSEGGSDKSDRGCDKSRGGRGDISPGEGGDKQGERKRNVSSSLNHRLLEFSFAQGSRKSSRIQQENEIDVQTSLRRNSYFLGDIISNALHRDRNMPFHEEMPTWIATPDLWQLLHNSAKQLRIQNLQWFCGIWISCKGNHWSWYNSHASLHVHRGR